MRGEIIKELKELNETFFELYARLDKYAEKMSDTQVQMMQKKLEEQYEVQYKLLVLLHVDLEREIKKLEAKRELLVPHKWRTRFLRRRRENYAATLVDEEARLEADRIFEECVTRIREAAEAPSDGAEEASGAPAEEPPSAAEEDAPQPPAERVQSGAEGEKEEEFGIDRSWTISS